MAGGIGLCQNDQIVCSVTGLVSRLNVYATKSRASTTTDTRIARRVILYCERNFWLKRCVECVLDYMCYIGDILDRIHGIKRCTKCGYVRKHYKCKGRKDRLMTYCVACHKKSCKEHYEENHDTRLTQAKEYYKENRDARLTQVKEYYKENRDEKRTYNKVYREENREAILAYREENRDAMLAYQKEYAKRPESKQKRNARIRTRRATDPAYRTRTNLGNALNTFMKGGKNGQRTFDIVGCTSEELVEYLDQTMSPETRAALEAGEKIEVDHIVPQRAPGIDIMNDAHVRAMYHYTNFQKLDRLTNGPKSNNVPEGYNTEIWVAEQHARIEACRGMKPVDTIPMNAKILADAQTFANTFRR